MTNAFPDSPEAVALELMRTVARAAGNGPADQLEERSEGRNQKMRPTCSISMPTVWPPSVVNEAWGQNLTRH
jgi:hypothetical protein